MKGLKFILKHSIKKSLMGLAMLSLVPSTAVAERYYFFEMDGVHVSIVYSAVCNGNGESGVCTLNSLSVGTANATLSKCSINVNNLFDSYRAIKSGDVWTSSVSGGICEYTNTYQISSSGMIQTKISPKVRRHPDCSVFEPKTYKMKYVKQLSEIKLGIEGCKDLSVLNF